MPIADIFLKIFVPGTVCVGHLSFAASYMNCLVVMASMHFAKYF